VNIAAFEEDVAVVGMEHSGYHFDRGGLAGSVWSEEPDNLAGRDLEADVFDGGNSAKTAEKVIDEEHGSPPVPYVAFSITRENFLVK
jgi:hypothetical protein